TSDAILRSLKARTEILFWWRYVSPKFHSAATIKLENSIATLDIPLLLSIFRHNPQLSSLFFPLFFSIRHDLDGVQQRDAWRIANFLKEFPRERTIFRTL